MFDFLNGFDQSLNDFLDSDAFQVGLRVLVIYILLIWLASAYWAYRDMRLRTASAVAPYIAAATIILFTPIFFLFGLLLYRIVRPKETIAEVNERALAEEAILAEVATRSQCANCSRPVHEDWIICPTCRNRLRRVCPNCEHLIELDWTLCAWCGKDFERAEAPGITAFMPTARPALPAQQSQPARQAPPPQRIPPSPLATAAAGSAAGSGQSASSNPQPPQQPQPRSSTAAAGSQASSSPRPSTTAPPTGAQAATGER